MCHKILSSSTPLCVSFISTFINTVKPDLMTTCEQRPPVNNGQFESSTASQNLSFIRHLCLTAAFFRSQGWPLYTGLTVHIFWRTPITLSCRTSSTKTSTSKTSTSKIIDWQNHRLAITSTDEIINCQKHRLTNVHSQSKILFNYIFYFFGLINLCQLKIELNIRKTDRRT
jgi:hypothetical protein